MVSWPCCFLVFLALDFGLGFVSLLVFSVADGLVGCVFCLFLGFKFVLSLLVYGLG